MKNSEFKVIKIIYPLNNPYEDVSIFDGFIAGGLEDCNNAILRDVRFYKKCEPDSGSIICYVNGICLEDEDAEGLDEILSAGVPNSDYSVKLQADDVYGTIYDIHYHVCENKIF